MFARFFQRKSAPKIATQPVGEVFRWPRHTVLKALDPLVLALPVELLGDDETIGSVIHFPDEARISIPETEGRILLRLQPGMAVSLTKSCEGCIVSDVNGDRSPRRVEIVSPPEKGA